MQTYYKPLMVEDGDAPAVMRGRYPDGTPIEDVCARMGWFVEPPADCAVYDETGAEMRPAPVKKQDQKPPKAKE